MKHLSTGGQKYNLKTPKQSGEPTLWDIVQTYWLGLFNDVNASESQKDQGIILD